MSRSILFLSNGGLQMANKRHKPEEIVSKLSQVDILVGQAVAYAEQRIGNFFACGFCRRQLARNNGFKGLNEICAG